MTRWSRLIGYECGRPLHTAAPPPGLESRTCYTRGWCLELTWTLSASPHILHTPQKQENRTNIHLVPSSVFVFQCVLVTALQSAALLVYRVVCTLHPLPDVMKGRVGENSLHRILSYQIVFLPVCRVTPRLKQCLSNSE